MVESVSTLSRVELTTCLYCTVPQVCTVRSAQYRALYTPAGSKLLSVISNTHRAQHVGLTTLQTVAFWTWT